MSEEEDQKREAQLKRVSRFYRDALKFDLPNGREWSESEKWMFGIGKNLIRFSKDRTHLLLALLKGVAFDTWLSGVDDDEEIDDNEIHIAFTALVNKAKKAISNEDLIVRDVVSLVRMNDADEVCTFCSTKNETWLYGDVGKRLAVKDDEWLQWLQKEGIKIPFGFSDAYEATTDENTAGEISTRLGGHTSTKLQHLIAAAEHFWWNFDPTKDTAPTNEEVVIWLKETRGVSDRTAEYMASIIRADGLRPGPRRK